MKAAASGEKMATNVESISKETFKNGKTGCKMKKIIYGPTYAGIFPEEVLERIFFHLDDPDDLFAVSNSCPQFQRILEPCKPVWSFDMVFPLIYPHLQKKDILNSRAVCKGWNKVVDTFLQTHPIIRSLEPYPHQRNPRRTYTGGNNDGPQYVPTLIQKKFFGDSFPTGRSIELFLWKTLSHPHHRNPFLMRFVELANCPLQETLPGYYWINAKNFLNRFGQHIWHIHLCPRSVYIGHDTIDNCYSILQKALIQLPNLRKLSISGFKGYDHHDLVDEDPFPYRVELVDYIRYHPLPALPYLEVLECSIPDHHKAVLVNDELMTRYGSQINKIFVWLSGWQKDKIQYQNMANLQELQLSVNDTNLACVQMIQSLNAPQLRKIYMIFQRDAEIMPVLKALKNSRPSLTYLGLWFRKKLEDSYESLSPPQFHLEEVKTLELVESRYVPYELLLSYFTNLEHVLILNEANQSNAADNKRDLEVEEQELPHSEIRELMLSRQIYKSEIWERMKNLKEFTLATLGKGLEDEQIVAKKQFTREIYEYLKKPELKKL